MGIQGDIITGIHGMGVSTPSLVAVAAATAGFVIVLHIPKDFIFTIEMQSVTEATFVPFISTLFRGVTISEHGVAPNEHAMIDPFITTDITVAFNSLSFQRTMLIQAYSILS